jgi:superfamily II DNA or RNA helicase
MMAERGRNTLVLVHRRQLMDQWIEKLTAFSGMPRGAIGGGHRKPKGQVDVALIQSLVRKGEVDDIVGNYGHLCLTTAKSSLLRWRPAGSSGVSNSFM